MKRSSDAVCNERVGPVSRDRRQGSFWFDRTLQLLAVPSASHNRRRLWQCELDVAKLTLRIIRTPYARACDQHQGEPTQHCRLRTTLGIPITAGRVWASPGAHT
eukprot:2648819-Prymnesium_polylepis.2